MRVWRDGVSKVLPPVVGVVVVCLAGATATASVQFFVQPDGNLNGIPPADPTRDLPFQAALTLPFTEFDFAEFDHEYILEPSPLLAGPVRVRPNLLDVNGNNAADLSLNGNRLLETWSIVPDLEGILEGGAGAGGATLLNRTFTGSGDLVGAAIEFTFSEPVEAFGTWIMDDILEPNGYVLKITEVGGAVHVSSLMEAGNGASLAIEGFIGAVSTVGITKAVVEQQTTGGTPSNVDFFYLDHVQVGGRFPPEICDNGIDDNADGEVDCDDGECANDAACPEDCVDGIDNDANGLIDCDDPDCQNNPSHPECGETFCADTLDNEGDGSTDCADADCFGAVGCTVEGICGDGFDNDSDGLTDCADIDCTADPACPETCDDGIDNDADGRVDCDDPECTTFPACMEICGDGIDNNGNDLVDCVDPACAADPSCQDAPTFFVEPDGHLAGEPPADPTRDLAFQAALGTDLTEFDFIQFVHGYITEPSNLFAGSVQVRPNLLDVNGNNAADLALNGNRLIETYPFISPDIPGIIEGGDGVPPNAPGTALLNRVFTGTGPDAVGAAVEFTFSEPVEGFGAWVMEDILEANQYVLAVTDALGRRHVSAPMESGNGTTQVIEGFIGAVSPIGITKAVIYQQTLLGMPSNADFFYLDHVQVTNGLGCGDPFADRDEDGDVDQLDFASFQLCFTGADETAAESCACFDRDGDGDVDASDFDAFSVCGSGPEVPADPACDD